MQLSPDICPRLPSPGTLQGEIPSHELDDRWAEGLWFRKCNVRVVLELLLTISVRQSCSFQGGSPRGGFCFEIAPH